MNTKIKDIAEHAGFVLWGDEPWNIGDVVDWNCRYDDELVKFAELIIKDCAVAHHKTRLSDISIESHFRSHLGIDECTQWIAE